MTKYLLIYHGSFTPPSEEEGQKLMAAWIAWFDSLGDAVVDSGNPVGKSITVHPGGKVTDDGGQSPAAGYTIVKAECVDAVAALAKSCPHLASGGTIEIAPIIEMG